MKIQITLREGKDDDLITWYQNATNGDRAFIIRSAIREYLKINKSHSIASNDPKAIKNNNKLKTNVLDGFAKW